MFHVKQFNVTQTFHNSSQNVSRETRKILPANYCNKFQIVLLLIQRKDMGGDEVDNIIVIASNLVFLIVGYILGEPRRVEKIKEALSIDKSIELEAYEPED